MDNIINYIPSYKNRIKNITKHIFNYYIQHITIKTIMSSIEDIPYDLSLIIYDLLPTNDKPKFVYAIDKNDIYLYHIEKEQKTTMNMLMHIISEHFKEINGLNGCSLLMHMGKYYYS